MPNAVLIANPSASQFTGQGWEPPLTAIVWPFKNAASVDARNATTRATSPAAPHRPNNDSPFARRSQ